MSGKLMSGSGRPERIPHLGSQTPGSGFSGWANRAALPLHPGAYQVQRNFFGGGFAQF